MYPLWRYNHLNMSQFFILTIGEGGGGGGGGGGGAYDLEF